MRDVGSSIEGAVGDKLSPKSNWIPVHTHYTDVSQYEVSLLEIIGASPLCESQTLGLHPSAHFDGKVVVVA